MHAMVTGANGHLGASLVAELLAGGHEVRAGIRSLHDASKAARAAALGAVRLVEADLDRPDTLASAMAGVEVLFHTAAVYALCDPGRDPETLRVSTEGLSAVLRAAAQAQVGKVVLTSSVVTVPLTRPSAAPSTEADWNDDLRVPYVRAKVQGERLAWSLAAELGLRLVTILPGAIGGPGFVNNTPTIDLLEAMMRNGFRLGVPHLNLPYVDVRDVARAHRLAAEREVQGRFIVVNDEQPMFRQIVEAMHAVDPGVKLPLAAMPDLFLGAVPYLDRLNARTLGTPLTASAEMIGMQRGKRYNASNRRAAELLDWRPSISLQESVADTLDTLRGRGAMRPNPRPALVSG